MWRVSLNSRNRCFSLSSRSVRPIPAQQFPPFPCWAMAAVALGFQVCHLWARVSPTPELHCSQWWNPGAVWWSVEDAFPFSHREPVSQRDAGQKCHLLSRFSRNSKEFAMFHNSPRHFEISQQLLHHQVGHWEL